MYEDIDALVFAGGGVRGLAYLGALMGFRDKYDIDWTVSEKVTKVAGTSIGSLVALMIATGWNLDEMMTFVNQLDLENLFFSYDMLNLGPMGLQDGSSLRALVEQVLGRKGFPLNITFQELFKLTKKHLVVTVTDLSCCGVQYICHETLPKAPVLDTVVASMSLPLVFNPVKYEDRLWVDGGLCDNFPIHLWPKETTLGFFVNYYVDNRHLMTSMLGYFSRIVATVSLTQERMAQESAKDHQVIRVDVGPVHALDSLSPDKVMKMIFKAYRDIMTESTNVVNRPLATMPDHVQNRYRLPLYWNTFTE